MSGNGFNDIAISSSCVKMLEVVFSHLRISVRAHAELG